MILQSLVSYYEALAARGEIVRPGWEKVKVSYALELDESGQLLGVLPLKVPTVDGKKMISREIILPARVKKTAGVSANFLCENAAYLLGIGDPVKPERVLDCFKAAKQLHQTLLSTVDAPCANAVCAFFEQWDTAAAREHPILLPYIEEFESGANLVFFVGDIYPQEHPEIMQSWQAHYDSEEEGTKMTCLVTGKKVVLAAIHPPIKGVSGAQSSGAALVSFNASADCSFDRQQNYNAPIGKYAAFAYTTALNYLIADKKHSKHIGDATVVYWAEDAEPGYRDAFSCYLDSDGDTVTNVDLDDLMKTIAQGGTVNWNGIPLKPENRFYVLALAPNAARLSVRFFLRDSFGRMVENLQAHYNRLQIVGDGRSKFQNIPLWALLRETINEKSKEKSASPQMAGDTLRAILTGGSYPATLYQQTQLRIRAEKSITRGRAAILKAYLIKNTDNESYKEALTVELNEKTTYQPYVLGRLFAVLEEIQNRVSGVTTIKDKYFSSACATPAVVFPLIMNLSDKHLRKLENGPKINYAKQIQALTGAITHSYPVHHTLYEQGIFQLGYYHQTQKRYQKKDSVATTEEER